MFGGVSPSDYFKVPEVDVYHIDSISRVSRSRASTSFGWIWINPLRTAGTSCRFLFHRSDNFLQEENLIVLGKIFFLLAPQALSQLQEEDVPTAEEVGAARALRLENEELQARLAQVTTTDVEV